jgi:hypothetical protein
MMYRFFISSIIAAFMLLAFCGSPKDNDTAAPQYPPVASPTPTELPAENCQTDDSGIMLKIVCTYYERIGTQQIARSFVFYVPKPINGHDGVDGHDGENGTSCTVSQTADGALIACTDGTFAVVLNGMNTGIPVNSVIDPCGPQSAYDEVLLRMDNHQVIAYLIGPGATAARLAVLPPGNYITSDGTNCYFVIHADGSVTY